MPANLFMLYLIKNTNSRRKSWEEKEFPRWIYIYIYWGDNQTRRTHVEGCHHRGTCLAKCSDEPQLLSVCCTKPVFTKCCLVWYINCLTWDLQGKPCFLTRKDRQPAYSVPAGAPVSDSHPPSSHLWRALYFSALILISHFHCRFLAELGQSKASGRIIFLRSFTLERNQPGMAVHTFNPSTVEAEEGGSLSSLIPARATQRHSVSKNGERKYQSYPTGLYIFGFLY